MVHAEVGASIPYRVLLADSRTSNHSDLEQIVSPSAILFAVVFATSLVLYLGIVAVAAGHGPHTGPLSLSELRQRMDSGRPTSGIGSAGTTLTESPLSPESGRRPITQTQYDVTRRRFFNRAIFAVFGLFVAQLALASLAFIWPKLKGGFGVVINVGSFDELKSEVIQGGTIVPKFFPVAQAWVVPMELSLISGSSYQELPYIVTGGQDDGVGLMALWMRCPHLGCRVPECIPSQGFECPCHGSKFNIHGEYAQGPSPRNMDRFAVSTNEAGEFIIDTGTIVQTARSKKYTAEYPLGPFCV